MIVHPVDDDRRVLEDALQLGRCVQCVLGGVDDGAGQCVDQRTDVELVLVFFSAPERRRPKTIFGDFPKGPLDNLNVCSSFNEHAMFLISKHISSGSLKCSNFVLTQMTGRALG